MWAMKRLFVYLVCRVVLPSICILYVKGFLHFIVVNQSCSMISPIVSAEGRHSFFNPIYIGLSPLPVTVANEGLQGSPTKHVIILVVSVTGRGDNPKYIFLFQIPSLRLCICSCWFGFLSSWCRSSCALHGSVTGGFGWVWLYLVSICSWYAWRHIPKRAEWDRINDLFVILFVSIRCFEALWFPTDRSQYQYL